MRALHVHHDANSSPGLIGEVLAALEYEAVVHQVCEIAGSPIGSPEFPDPQSFDLIVLYGSRWSVYEEHVDHWVIPELDFLRAADSFGIPVLGLCFGAQLLSAAHGGLVAATDTPEVGWYRVQSHVPDIEPGPWLEWHFDTFTVPADGEELARTESGPQAFRLRRNLGVQFHPEADRAVIEEWFQDDIDQVELFGIDPDELLEEADRQRSAARSRAERLVRTFLGRPGWLAPICTKRERVLFSRPAPRVDRGQRSGGSDAGRGDHHRRTGRTACAAVAGVSVPTDHGPCDRGLLHRTA